MYVRYIYSKFFSGWKNKKICGWFWRDNECEGNI